MAKAPAPRRGEVWLVDFDPAVGVEIQKVRPAVVINMDTIGRLPLRMVVPITDWKPSYATVVRPHPCGPEKWIDQRFGRRLLSDEIRFGTSACPSTR